ncbi:hypothetical protein HYALB_00010171 [Hymenoscyphus albidus]|uniref:DUF3328 domain-containing protein n=1 Tax=Hymenoscyphus albidus TaxID=595503 RepID=A0A9N9LEQ4_9HELO|nr:hypothetical protein HYALB_00010171 [Hymenoscyphus albidus]
MKFLPFQSSQQDLEYMPIEKHGGDKKTSPCIRGFFVVFGLLVVLTICVLSFEKGRAVGERGGIQEHVLHVPPPAIIDHTFYFHEEFEKKPAKGDVWTKVPPRGRGIIYNPSVAPSAKGVAIWHQLHCLDALRKIYWSSLDGSKPDLQMKPPHVKHCIEYMRQALMCNADTTLEPIDDELGGVTGFGNKRKCRDVMAIREMD